MSIPKSERHKSKRPWRTLGSVKYDATSESSILKKYINISENNGPMPGNTKQFVDFLRSFQLFFSPSEKVLWLVETKGTAHYFKMDYWVTVLEGKCRSSIPLSMSIYNDMNNQFAKLTKGSMNYVDKNLITMS